MPNDGLTSPQPAVASTGHSYYPGEEVTAGNPLFRQYQMGPFSLPHRIAMAPLTRQRALGKVPQMSAIKMYSDRATGGLIIAEATAVSVEGHGYPHVPGIYTQEQIEAWKPIVKAVHDKGSPFFLQIWHAGRTSHTDFQPNGAAPVSSTSKGIMTGQVTTEKGVYDFATSTPPRALETHEIPGIVEQFRMAAHSAIEAGFDGVEIHAAHGYLIDQFLKDNINDRTDEYGGSIENRSRLALEVGKAVADEVGPDRVGIRLSPYTDLYSATDSNPNALMAYIIPKLNELNLLYLHIMEPRVGPGLAHQEVDESEKSLKPFRKMFKNTFIVAGGYTRKNGMEVIDAGHADLVAYGRHFIANPDLVKRIALDLPWNAYDRSTFYSQEQVKGYNDYPFYEEMKGSKA